MPSSEAGGNVQRLQEAGFAIKTPLPMEYEQVINDLESAHVDLLISIKERLDAAQAATPPEVGSYAAYILGPVF